MANPPWRHHYIPQFYLRGWCGADGCLQVFDRPHLEVKTRRLAPAGIGYEPHLYSTPGVPAAEAQRIEQEFFREVDTQGAAALAKLLTRSSEEWSTRERSAWSRTITGLLTRAPEELAALKRAAQAHWDADPAPNEEYERLRRDSDPATWEEWLAIHAPHVVERVALDSFLTLVDDDKIGAFINQMHWQVLNLGPASKTLLSSDRPVLRSQALDDPAGYIALPISPQALFVAATHREFFSRLQRRHPTEIARTVNEGVVKQAVRFVIGTTDVAGAYIRCNMGAMPARYAGYSMEAAAREIIRSTKSGRA